MNAAGKIKCGARYLPETKAAILHEAEMMRKAGRSFREIAVALNKMGYKTPLNRDFRAIDIASTYRLSQRGMPVPFQKSQQDDEVTVSSKDEQQLEILRSNLSKETKARLLLGI